MRSALGQIFIPTPDLGFCAVVLSIEFITSMHSMNMYGDKGSPCRIPLVGLIIPTDSPFTSKEYEAVVIHSIINLINLLWKPY